MKLYVRWWAIQTIQFLAEALEKWPLAYLDEVVPHLVVIIKKLDKLVRAEYKDPAVQIIDNKNVCIWRTWTSTFQIL